MSALTHLHRRVHPTLIQEGLGWRTVAPGIVEVHVDIAHDGDEPTDPAELTVEAAPLGAFVPTHPVTKIAVGSMDPGERRRITARVNRSFLEVLSKCYPGIRRDTLDLMAQSEWAGNLNVWFEPDRQVELHQALNLNIRAGQPVYLMFFTQARTTCAVRVSDPLWEARVDRMDNGGILIVDPPMPAGLSARVTVEVTRKSDARMVPVKFSFVTVEGQGASLGCITA